MYGRRFLFNSFFVLVVLTLLNLVGIIFSLYWRLWWYDIPAHVLGGVSVALAAAWLQAIRGERPTFLFCISAVFAVGVAWEIFEAVSGLTQFPQDTVDTIKDLCDDVIGGLITLLLIYRRPVQ